MKNVQGTSFSVTFTQIDPVNLVFHGTLAGKGACTDGDGNGGDASGTVTVQF